MEEIKKCITPRDKFTLDKNYFENKSYGSNEDLNIIDYIEYQNKKNKISYDDYILSIEKKYLKQYIKDNNENNYSICFYIRTLFCLE